MPLFVFYEDTDGIGISLTSPDAGYRADGRYDYKQWESQQVLLTVPEPRATRLSPKEQFRHLWRTARLLGRAAGGLVVISSTLDRDSDKLPADLTLQQEPEPMATPPEAGPACSFCGRDGQCAEVMIAGDGAAICDGCVAVCLQIIEDHKNSRADSSGPAQNHKEQSS